MAQCQADYDFNILLSALSNFSITRKPVTEYELENWLVEYLGLKGFNVERQPRLHSNRNDIIVKLNKKRFCIELKRFADRSCTAQLDRYASQHIEGLILVCWQASKAMRKVFKIQKPYAKIQVALVEVKKNCDFS